MSDYCEYINGNCKYCEEGRCEFPLQGSGYPYEAPCFGYKEEGYAGKPTVIADSDTISRAKAIDGKICIQRSNGVEIYDDYAVPVEYLKRLPPAQPKTGKWTNVVDGIKYTWGICDKCGAHIPMPYKYYEYCPHCGAKMDVEVTE